LKKAPAALFSDISLAADGKKRQICLRLGRLPGA
jgi:hypothetical protein